MRKILLLLIFLSPGLSLADIYDDFIESNIVGSAREKMIQRYKDQEAPEGVDAKQWREGTDKLIEKVNNDLIVDGPIFRKIKESYKSNMTEEDMKLFIEVISSPRFKAVMTKNKQVKYEVTEIMENYVFEDLMEASERIRSPE